MKCAAICFPNSIYLIEVSYSFYNAAGNVVLVNIGFLWIVTHPNTQPHNTFLLCSYWIQKSQQHERYRNTNEETFSYNFCRFEAAMMHKIVWSLIRMPYDTVPSMLLYFKKLEHTTARMHIQNLDTCSQRSRFEHK